MDDFITNRNVRKICERCEFEYLKSDFCQECFIDTYVVNKSLAWCENEDFKKFAIYNGINLGELIDYDLRRILLKAIFILEKGSL